MTCFGGGRERPVAPEPHRGGRRRRTDLGVVRRVGVAERAEVDHAVVVLSAGRADSGEHALGVDRRTLQGSGHRRRYRRSLVPLLVDPLTGPDGAPGAPAAYDVDERVLPDGDVRRARVPVVGVHARRHVVAQAERLHGPGQVDDGGHLQRAAGGGQVGVDVVTDGRQVGPGDPMGQRGRHPVRVREHQAVGRIGGRPGVVGDELGHRQEAERSPGHVRSGRGVQR